MNREEYISMSEKEEKQGCIYIPHGYVSTWVREESEARRDDRERRKVRVAWVTRGLTSLRLK